MLIDVVGIEQRYGEKGCQQIFREGFDQHLGAVADLNTHKVWGVGLPPLGEALRHLLVEDGEFGVGEDGGLDLAGLDLELAVAGAVGGCKQLAAHSGKYIPISSQAVDVAVGHATL